MKNLSLIPALALVASCTTTTQQAADPPSPEQRTSTVSAPSWVADHYIDNTNQNHVHTGATQAALEQACLEHFPKPESNTSITTGTQVHTCRNARYGVTVTYGPNPNPVNCVVSEWGPWDPAVCTAPATQTRTRTVVTPPSNGGTACPPLTETQTCPPAAPVETWTKVGNEGDRIQVSKPGKYRYGCVAGVNGCPATPAAGRWSTTRDMVNAFTCSNTTFGGDPIYGVVKECQLSSLPPGGGTGQATLRWTAPTQNTDGSPLTDLAGYKILYGSEVYPQSWNVTVPAPATSYTVTGLPGGITIYFLIRAMNAAGQESPDSAIVTKVMP